MEINGKYLNINILRFLKDTFKVTEKSSILTYLKIFKMQWKLDQKVVFFVN